MPSQILIRKVLFALCLALVVVLCRPLVLLAEPFDFVSTSHKAKQGDVAAQSHLGMMYYTGIGVDQDYLKALVWLLKAAEQGDANAQVLLGGMYSQGEGISRDYQKAATWYLKAANQGNDNAQYILGLLYQEGKGVPLDIQQSINWYTRAADQGYVEAQFSLGMIFYKGEVVPTDYKKAAFWYTKAAEQGKTEAQFFLGLMYGQGEGVGQDFQKSAEWLTKSTKAGHAESQYLLGLLYQQGEGVSKDNQKATDLLTKAAAQGLVEAQFSLGRIYEKGQGVIQDYKTAVYWYNKAAEQGEAKAQYCLGYSYGVGQGVPQNFVLAYVWSNLAVASGYDKAIKNRDLAAAKLTPQELAEAQTLAARIQEKIQTGSALSPPLISKSPNLPVGDQTITGTGSGFIITSEGHILTCAHVVKDAGTIKIKRGALVQEAKLVRIDSASDLAVLKESISDPVQPLAFATTRSASLGQDVFTVGFPNPELQGISAKLTKGSVSSLAGILDDSRRYQISVPVQPGNSGGPLLDSTGNVIGIIEAQIKDEAALQTSGSLPQNVNYAIKSPYALSLIDSIPEIAKKLPKPQIGPRAFEETAREVENSVVLIVVYGKQ